MCEVGIKVIDYILTSTDLRRNPGSAVETPRYTSRNRIKIWVAKRSLYSIIQVSIVVKTEIADGNLMPRAHETGLAHIKWISANNAG